MYCVKEDVKLMMPRERLYTEGERQMSEQDLLAIILRTGSKDLSVNQLAQEILNKFISLDNLRNATIEELQTIKGIGRVKAVEIKAMIELGRRIHISSNKNYGQVQSSTSLGQDLMNEMGDLKQEHLVTLYLDTKNKIIRKRTIFIGTVNSSTANPREILHYAVKYMATSIIVVHNHPSGDTKPSKNDKNFTKKISEACGFLGVNFLDHMIIGKEEYFSFRENNLI